MCLNAVAFRSFNVVVYRCILLYVCCPVTSSTCVWCDNKNTNEIGCRFNGREKLGHVVVMMMMIMMLVCVSVDIRWGAVSSVGRRETGKQF